MTSLLLALVSVAVASAAAMTVTALVARREGRVVVVDVAWGVALTISATAAAISTTKVRAGVPMRAIP